LFEILPREEPLDTPCIDVSRLSAYPEEQEVVIPAA